MEKYEELKELIEDFLDGAKDADDLSELKALLTGLNFAYAAHKKTHEI